MVVRDLLAQQTRRFDALTDVQQDAWNTAAAAFQSTPALGQSGPLTGLQLFVQINCKLGLLGQAAGGRAAGRAAVPRPGAPGPGHHQHRWRGRAEADLPDGPGREHGAAGQPAAELGGSGVPELPHHRHLPGGGARFGGHHGAVRGGIRRGAGAGKRLFVRASTMVNGFESLPRQFQARVPAA